MPQQRGLQHQNGHSQRMGANRLRQAGQGEVVGEQLQLHLQIKQGQDGEYDRDQRKGPPG